MMRSRRSSVTSPAAARRVLDFAGPAVLAIALVATGCPGVQPRIPGHGPLDPNRAAPDKDAPGKGEPDPPSWVTTAFDAR